MKDLDLAGSDIVNMDQGQYFIELENCGDCGALIFDKVSLYHLLFLYQFLFRINLRPLSTIKKSLEQLTCHQC